MAAIKEVGLNVRENGIALSLGAKVQILEDKDVDALIKALLELLTLQQKVEDISNQLKDMETEVRLDITRTIIPSPTTNPSPSPTPTPTTNGGRR
jgi:ABC-type ATPase involved in cell division